MIYSKLLRFLLYARDVLSLAILYSGIDSDCEDLFLLPELGKRSESEQERLIHTVVHMHLISEKSRKMGYPGNFHCNSDGQPQ